MIFIVHHDSNNFIWIHTEHTFDLFNTLVEIIASNAWKYAISAKLNDCIYKPLAELKKK